MIYIVTHDGPLFDMLASLLREEGAAAELNENADDLHPCIVDIDAFRPYVPAGAITISRRLTSGAELIRPFAWEDFILLCRRKFPQEFKDKGPAQEAATAVYGTEKAEDTGNRKILSERACTKEEAAESAGADKAVQKSAGKAEKTVERTFDFNFDNDKVYYRGVDLMLTDTERRLFTLLYERRPEPVSSDEINSAIWSGGQPGNSAAVYISYLRTKLDYRFSERIIVTKKGKGYCIYAD